MTILAFAMPETGIGFIPDIGASYFLSRCRARPALYLALTGARIGLGDALALGLSPTRVDASRSRCLIARLARRRGARKAPSRLSPASRRRRRLARASRAASTMIFAAPSVEAIWSGWTATAAISPRDTAQTIRTRSPTSLKLAFRAIARGKGAVAERMSQNGISRRRCARVMAHDFREGVRAALIDKDGTPRWQPSRWPAVTRLILRLFRAAGRAGTVALPKIRASNFIFCLP